jgi:CheY-like chemotaxis protein
VRPLVCFLILPIVANEKLSQYMVIRRAGETAGRMTKILLVDDSKFLRMATERALARVGYLVKTASDGVEAIEVARREKPDVILLDMMLPKKSGPDVLKALKKDPATAGIKVVAFTGLSGKNAMRLEQDGACAFLEKASLDLDKGCETLLRTLAGILRELKLEVPAGARRI